jgi:hypothetical protein
MMSLRANCININIWLVDLKSEPPYNLNLNESEPMRKSNSSRGGECFELVLNRTFPRRHRSLQSAVGC